ncbi:hypothetical protein CUMW_063740 [Citrus unshiu]|uniref:Growth-regulating factor n=1 Tax=Citrus sinensis TaxID=2711 RepID=A0A067H4L8_CITSI|nr:hypothetical protein CISIN_1g040599mg [Citrus sinensis]GAY42023.1 hypothetical protein CUMW_063740 [Citrus unshiu]
MKAGLPVPCHVLMPMWREVASSFGSDPSSVYNLYPSLGRKVDHRIVMDLEPGRCRRTNGNKWRCRKNSVPDQKYVDASQIANLLDGKKWRHSRDTIPNQKYCEMQMHRGAKKRVEPKNPVPNFSIDTTSSPFLPSTMITSANADSATSDSILCISVPKSPQVATRSPSSSRCYHQ